MSASTIFAITGDIHGNPYVKFSEEAFPEQKEMTKDDYVIITGDAGLVWSFKGESKQEKENLDWLENRSFTTLFCDGNHENFDRLYQYPVKEWNGGLVHEIRPSVLHLMRGQVYNINGTKFFVFGGARSHDIDDGILELDDPRLPQFSQERKRFRINHVSWWEQEMPSEEERKTAIKNLEKNNWTVDYVITHDMPTSDLTLFAALRAHKIFEPDELNNYLDDIRAKLNYKFWFCGHYHDDYNITRNEGVLLFDIVMLYR